MLATNGLARQVSAAGVMLTVRRTLGAIVWIIAVYCPLTALVRAERPPALLSALAERADHIVVAEVRHQARQQRGVLLEMKGLHIYRGALQRNAIFFVLCGTEFCSVDGPRVGEVALLFLAGPPSANGQNAVPTKSGARQSERKPAVRGRSDWEGRPLQIMAAGRGQIQLARNGPVQRPLARFARGPYRLPRPLCLDLRRSASIDCGTISDTWCISAQ